ncbi:hypothetical protein K431DRAFT_301976 [Polychaeton citri CBS 116435]|uniref:Uncharacterized protein n=1 Tax=Polychaeton citri CBS 116435 TaxID=1314669 RepID=A0A9P4USF7_9PEZI|nr:hypothetical protein K431DRAFT_301976 [Polychaeton citri CBS 116435]
MSSSDVEAASGVERTRHRYYEDDLVNEAFVALSVAEQQTKLYKDIEKSHQDLDRLEEACLSLQSEVFAARIEYNNLENRLFASYVHGNVLAQASDFIRLFMRSPEDSHVIKQELDTIRHELDKLERQYLIMMGKQEQQRCIVARAENTLYVWKIDAEINMRHSWRGHSATNRKTPSHEGHSHSKDAWSHSWFPSSSPGSHNFGPNGNDYSNAGKTWNGRPRGYRYANDQPPKPIYDSRPKSTPTKSMKAWVDSIAHWRSQVNEMVGNHAALSSFPMPPAQPCSKETCIRDGSSSDKVTCECNVRDALDTAKVNLRKERTQWHPDKFSRCREDFRDEFQSKAHMIFTIINTMMEETN